jgi:adenine phosphoribosyltransferase
VPFTQGKFQERVKKVTRYMMLEDQIRQSIRDVRDYPKPGVLFKDITPLMSDPALFRDITAEMVSRLKGIHIDAIAAVEARGFIFGSVLAHELRCRFIPVRKAGKLPYKTKSVEYSLEYGSASIEMHEDAIEPGWKVLVHDDVLATGGTAAAAGQLVQHFNAELVGFSFLINLSFLPGKDILSKQFGLIPQYLIEY